MVARLPLEPQLPPRPVVVVSPPPRHAEAARGPPPSPGTGEKGVAPPLAERSPWGFREPGTSGVGWQPRPRKPAPRRVPRSGRGGAAGHPTWVTRCLRGGPGGGGRGRRGRGAPCPRPRSARRPGDAAGGGAGLTWREGAGGQQAPRDQVLTNTDTETRRRRTTTATNSSARCDTPIHLPSFARLRKGWVGDARTPPLAGGWARTC